ncbi:hypothetical protein [Faecalicatena orotica]|uniref:hypothetical protein n=1 Tax=Faecalicatena orotica TaxID=1544 RepID=UPI003216C97B
MAEKELLNALSEMMDSKFEALKRDVVLNMATKDDIRNMATKDDIANMATKEDIRNMVTKDDIADLVTKEDLRYAENVILSEVDRVQEKSNMHYHELKEDICQLRREVRSMNVEGLRYRVERLEAIVL